MASEDHGRDDILPDSSALWNGTEVFAFPLLHGGGPDFGTKDISPFSFMPLQVSPSPIGSYHGDPANYISHASTDNLSTTISSVTQDSKPLIDPFILRDMFPAESNHVLSSSALNGRKNYDMNNSLQLHEVQSNTDKRLLTGFRYATGNLNVSGGRDMVNDYRLQLDINRNPVDIGDEPGINTHVHDNWMMSGAPQLDSSGLDGRILSLGHEDSACSGWESFAFAGDCSVSRSSLPPFRQEASPLPVKPISDGAYGSLHSEKLVPSGTVGCLTLSHDDFGNLPGLTSGFDASPSLLSSGQHPEVHQFMPVANDWSLGIENDANSGYTEIGSRACQTTATGLLSNIESSSSEPECAWMLRFPSEAITTRSSQQSVTEEHKNANLRSNVFSFQSPTSVISRRKDQPDQVSHGRSKHAPASQVRVPSICADQAVPVSSTSELIHDSKAECKSLLKRSSSSFSSVTPRKIMRQHSVGPSHLYTQHAQPQSSIANITNVHPKTSPTFTNITQPPIHQYMPSPVQFPPLQNSLGNCIPAFTPFANSTSSNDTLAKAIPSRPQSSIVKSTRGYPNFSPTFTNITRPPLHSSLSSPRQIAPFQNASGSGLPAFNPFANSSSLSSDSLPRAVPPPFHGPSFMSPVQTVKPSNALKTSPPGFAASMDASCFSATYLPKAVRQPSITSLPGSVQNSLPGDAIGNSLPISAATGNSCSGFDSTAKSSLPIPTVKIPVAPAASERNPASGKALLGPSKKTTSTEHNLSARKHSSVFRRFLERQSQALAAFEKKSPALTPAAMTSSMPHIKWQGIDKPEASGFKCLLCKRDLAYAPEGPMSIPAIPPEVAVLPCGHTFHNSCLMVITPQDQSMNPPCIPCSIGDF